MIIYELLALKIPYTDISPFRWVPLFIVCISSIHTHKHTCAHAYMHTHTHTLHAYTHVLLSSSTSFSSTFFLCLIFFRVATSILQGIHVSHSLSLSLSPLSLSPLSLSSFSFLFHSLSFLRRLLFLFSISQRCHPSPLSTRSSLKCMRNAFLSSPLIGHPSTRSEKAS